MALDLSRSLATALLSAAICVACTSDVSAPSPATASHTDDSTRVASAAVAQLDALPVIPRRPVEPGYQRGCGAGQACSFGPAWTDDTDAPGGHNGCDTRNDLLQANMSDIVMRAGSNCVVIAGRYDDPYTGKTIEFAKADASAIQVDHVVPLAMAWDLGAAQWSQDRRNAFANDQDIELTLTDGRTNQIKGDSGPSEWMPPNTAYRCNYAAKFIQSLTTYGLPVVAADSTALRAALDAC